jgi:hypothetical protein
MEQNYSKNLRGQSNYASLYAYGEALIGGVSAGETLFLTQRRD